MIFGKLIFFFKEKKNQNEDLEKFEKNFGMVFEKSIF